MKYILPLLSVILISNTSFAKSPFSSMKMEELHIPYFNKDCETEVAQLIDQANTNIDVAVYAINNDIIVTALENAKARNVQIRILTDHLQAENKHSKVLELYKKGFDIRVHSKDRIMHHKFMIVDGIIAEYGSFNWTYSAANKNSEDCHISNEERDVKEMSHHFEYLWQVNTKDISDCYFLKMQKDLPNLRCRNY